MGRAGEGRIFAQNESKLISYDSFFKNFLYLASVSFKMAEGDIYAHTELRRLKDSFVQDSTSRTSFKVLFKFSSLGFIFNSQV